MYRSNHGDPILSFPLSKLMPETGSPPPRQLNSWSPTAPGCFMKLKVMKLVDAGSRGWNIAATTASGATEADFQDHRSGLVNHRWHLDDVATLSTVDAHLKTVLWGRLVSSTSSSWTGDNMLTPLWEVRWLVSTFGASRVISICSCGNPWLSRCYNRCFAVAFLWLEHALSLWLCVHDFLEFGDEHEPLYPFS